MMPDEIEVWTDKSGSMNLHGPTFSNEVAVGYTRTDLSNAAIKHTASLAKKELQAKDEEIARLKSLIKEAAEALEDCLMELSSFKGGANSDAYEKADKLFHEKLKEIK